MRQILLTSAAALAAASAAAAGPTSGFGPGTYTVGQGSGRVAPGTYRGDGGRSCTWARLRSGGSVIATESPAGPAVVTILRADGGFSSHGCGRWTSNLDRVTASLTRFGNGTYIVGTDILAGTYQAPGGPACSWARLRNFTGSRNAILSSDAPQGIAVVGIGYRDVGFISRGCGVWTRF